ncbi:hypothetical protein MNBD_NITROSPINAE04-205 [hydrothermal vent metagenome]|uniref:Chemotaxis methyl-accepting receptor HlyB-like 4HB MCP domain-containing protein n=1 Tax=hydrothermal vent metagenome TaxID=652676 RepID=A0A3B1D571_9ZZZZ
MVKNSSIQFKVGLIIAFAALALTITWGKSHQSLNQVEDNWDGFVDIVYKKQRPLSEIRSAIGYGGLVQQVKNAIMRGRDKFFVRTEDRASKAFKKVEAYRSIKPLSITEDKALGKIREMITVYRDAGRLAKKLWSEGKTVAEIDGSVKISDKPYLVAMETLAGELAKSTKERTGKINVILSSNKTFLVYFSLGFILVYTIVVFVFANKTLLNPLYNIIRSLSDGASQIMSASGQISLSSQTLAEGSTEQASSLEETSAALDQMATMTKAERLQCRRVRSGV